MIHINKLTPNGFYFHKGMQGIVKRRPGGEWIFFTNFNGRPNRYEIKVRLKENAWGFVDLDTERRPDLSDLIVGRIVQRVEEMQDLSRRYGMVNIIFSDRTILSFTYSLSRTCRPQHKHFGKKCVASFRLSLNEGSLYMRMHDRTDALFNDVVRLDFQDFSPFNHNWVGND